METETLNPAHADDAATAPPPWPVHLRTNRGRNSIIDGVGEGRLAERLSAVEGRLDALEHTTAEVMGWMSRLRRAIHHATAPRARPIP